MTAWISDPPLDSTDRLVAAVLRPTLGTDERVQFLVPAGESDNILQRIRVMISRSRKRMIAKDRKPKRFKLRSTIHPYTQDGKRFDCVVMWVEMTGTDHMTQDLEDLLTNG